MDDPEDNTIVFDNGSGVCRGGFAGDDAPRMLFPNLIGKSRSETTNKCLVDTKPSTFIGDDAQRKRDVLSLTYPIDRGIITDWDAMEEIWRYSFRYLGVESENYRVLCSDAAYTPKANRERMTQMMFETFNVPGFYRECDGMLALYAYGRPSGVMLDCGEGVTTATTVYEGWAIPHSYQRNDFAGKDVTEHLAKLLGKRGYSFSTPAELEQVREIKEELAHVALDSQFIFDGSSEETVTYELPDGQRIKVGNERFEAMEILFQPSLIGLSLPGIHQLLHNCLMQCDIDVRRDLQCSILLVGGSSICQGFADRLQKELKQMLPHARRARVIAYPERKYSVWIGGSIMGSLTSSEHVFITKQEYEEWGPNITFKCSADKDYLRNWQKKE